MGAAISAEIGAVDRKKRARDSEPRVTSHPALSHLAGGRVKETCSAAWASSHCYRSGTDKATRGRQRGLTDRRRPGTLSIKSGSIQTRQHRGSEASEP